jgi:uncharacterized surface protein with fasciclin (FAS1) repeats
MSTDPLEDELTALKQRALAGDISGMRDSYERGELRWLRSRMTPEIYAHLGLALDSGDLESVRSDLATVKSPIAVVPAPLTEVDGDRKSLFLQSQRNGLIAVGIIGGLVLAGLLGYLALRNNNSENVSDTTIAMTVLTNTIPSATVADTFPQATVTTDSTLPETLPPPSTVLSSPAATKDALSSTTTSVSAATPPTSAPAPPITAAGVIKADVLATAERSSTFGSFLAMIDAAGLREEIQSLNPATVLAPTESAFSSLPSEVQAGLKSSANKVILARIVRYHVIPQSITLRQFTTSEVKTLEGSPLSVFVGNNKVALNEATVTGADVMTTTGVLHAIDRLLVPPGVNLNALVPKPVPSPSLTPQSSPPSTQPVPTTAPVVQPPTTGPLPPATTIAFAVTSALPPTTARLP